MLLLASSLICFSAWGFLRRYTATHNSKPIIPTETVTHSMDTPDETPPVDACDAYTAPANEPRKIEVPSIGTSGCVQKVGIDQRNAIAAPTNIHLAGWYVNSALPGEKGVSIIDGHVQGRYGTAIFTNLDRLRSGDQIKVQLGDESWREFEVVSIGTYSVNETNDELFKSANGVDKQLTLVTCAGTYNSQTKTYDKRVIVRAKKV